MPVALAALREALFKQAGLADSAGVGAAFIGRWRLGQKSWARTGRIGARPLPSGGKEARQQHACDDEDFN